MNPTDLDLTHNLEPMMPIRQSSFTSPLHSERVASLLGLALGVCFSIAFVTGVISHLIQSPPGWFTWPSRPAGLYRVTQGLHVATGIASIPLLLAKLWSVYPKLWRWPPVVNGLHLIERAALLPLVAGSLFLLFTGLVNIGLFYPWGFFFPLGHFWASWITIGAMIVHVGAKATIVRRSLAAENLDIVDVPGHGLTRRGFLGVVAASVGVVTITTVGQTFHPLNRFAVLAPRRPDVGPQGFPVNKTAAGAGVIELASSPDYRLKIAGNVERDIDWSLAELQALPQTEATLPISCVEGWSANVRWSGVRLSDLLEMAGAPVDSELEVISLQPRGLYRKSSLNRQHAQDRDTLVALKANGETLHMDHGYPCRLIGPNRPGVMQTKWLSEIVVL